MQSRRLLTFVLSLVFLIGGLGGLAMADRRVALVIGNSDYRNADKLPNPVIDSRNVRDLLTKLHFDVIYGEDLDKRGMERAIGRFAGPAQDADVALVYFAGHGATFGDTPYVVPTDADFTTLESIPYELVPVETLVGELRRAKGVRIAILDACRDNSAEHNLKSGQSRGGTVTRGLAPVKDPNGLILAYATQYLQTAADGDPSRDSPFTTALLSNLSTPGLDVKEVFFRVGSDVVARTNGRQRPEISVSLYDPYTLVPADPSGSPAAAHHPELTNAEPQGHASDDAAWALVESHVTPAAIRGYLAAFPDGSHAWAGRKRLADFDDQAWRDSEVAKSIRLMKDYLTDFPDGAHRDAALARIAALEATEAGPRPRHDAPPTMQAVPKKAQRRQVDPQGGSHRSLAGAGGDATAQSYVAAPPHTLGSGQVVSITAPNGRKMTCVGGQGNVVPRRCSWD